MIRIAAAMMMVAAGATRLSAQDPIAGKWSMDYPTAIRSENGEETVVSSRKATFDFTMRGDSIAGTWTLAPDSTGTAPKPLAVHGVRTGTSYTIETEPVDRHIVMNGDDHTIRMATKYTFEVHGEQLAGASTLFAVDGSMDMPSRLFVAAREKP
ncbi:MAG TPA: hypothetical protein VGM20_12775 [Gemmatimonadales bacterium]|jgi:hypothetical protein